MTSQLTSDDEILLTYGNILAEQIFDKLESKELSIDDDIVIKFLPCMYGIGNLEKLKIISKTIYDDTRNEIICEFIDFILKKVIEGQRRLSNGKNH